MGARFGRLLVHGVEVSVLAYLRIVMALGSARISTRRCSAASVESVNDHLSLHGCVQLD